MNINLVVIDPQNDFCDPNGSLFVPGADKDIERLAKMVDRIGDRIDINVTLDQHHTMDVGNPIMWKDKNGKTPVVDIPAGAYPFAISHEDISTGVWSPYFDSWRQRFLDYTKALKQGGRYDLMVWPYHCLIGSWGANIVNVLQKALFDWEIKHHAMVNKVTKGSNMWTEHYSAVKADVADPLDKTTDLNKNFITLLQNSDMVIFSGEALSHCVKFTMLDVADTFGDENIKKIVFLEDASSPVFSFEQQAQEFVHSMVQRGMQVSTTDKILR